MVKLPHSKQVSVLKWLPILLLIFGGVLLFLVSLPFHGWLAYRNAAAIVIIIPPALVVGIAGGSERRLSWLEILAYSGLFVVGLYLAGPNWVLVLLRSLAFTLVIVVATLFQMRGRRGPK